MGIRTPDLLIANETLYQLSYTPESRCRRGLCRDRCRPRKAGRSTRFAPLHFPRQPESVKEATPNRKAVVARKIFWRKRKGTLQAARAWKAACRWILRGAVRPDVVGGDGPERAHLLGGLHHALGRQRGALWPQTSDALGAAGKDAPRDLPERVAGTGTMERAVASLRADLTIGDFLAYQYVTDLNYNTLTSFSETEFVVPGTDAISGLRKCFALTPASSPTSRSSGWCRHGRRNVLPLWVSPSGCCLDAHCS